MANRVSKSAAAAFNGRPGRNAKYRYEVTGSREARVYLAVHWAGFGRAAQLLRADRATRKAGDISLAFFARRRDAENFATHVLSIGNNYRGRLGRCANDLAVFVR